MKKISIVLPTYNEEKNIDEIYFRIINSIGNINNLIFEIIFIDNHSLDTTVDKIKNIIKTDSRVKLIVNTRNFGHIRSPYWGVIQATGDAVIYLASDLQDDPQYIPGFIKKWEEGYLVVMAVKNESKLSFFNKKFRELYYSFLSKISDHKIIKNSTGFGLYDKKVIQTVRDINDPEPFFRGIVAELGFKTFEYKTIQNRRSFGISKNNIYSLYDYAILGIVSSSILPIRAMTILGFLVSIGSFLLGTFFILKKLIFWNSYTLGVSPIMLPLFFLFGIQFIFIGIIGEYLRIVVIKSRNRPVVVESERYNF